MSSTAYVPGRLRKIIKAARRAGWTYDLTSRGHPRLTPPPGTCFRSGELCGQITFAGSPSDQRGDKNGIARLRRAGLDV